MEVVDIVTDAREQFSSTLHPTRLAYLAVTGKVETQIRDELAWRLHRHSRVDGSVAREWRRHDIAVLGDAGPTALVELKALYGFDTVPGKAGAPDEYQQKIKRDVQRCLAWTGATLVFVALVTHVDGPVALKPHGLVKYAASINHFPRRPSDDELHSFIEVAGTPVAISTLTHEEALGVRAEVRAVVWTPHPASGPESPS